ncbi:hypothetical protein BBBOND_0307660 [Babesia bigemina]|uniref:Uncharacterized protein n=1 Tax=Babesia bigemina TaxID=5866 RepID=A0A061DA77_BABBI|nr:hypothetical protein BBBOND_0307660 [Babesia bigemina]CDR96862.1 hypothetical protein BBBOND_0307660 [Babesia bigemina]|eukprot:XP_012769048.1 hypothetical protein BBBOND_0307660 [Babesia bigemina]
MRVVDWLHCRGWTDKVLSEFHTPQITLAFTYVCLKTSYYLYTHADGRYAVKFGTEGTMEKTSEPKYDPKQMVIKYTKRKTDA